MNINASDLTAWLGRVYNRTQEVAEAVPPEYFDWQPDPNEFTCDDILRHIASCRLMNTRRIFSGELHYPGHTESLAAEPSQVLDYLRDSAATSLTMLTEAGETVLTRIVPSNQGDISGWNILLGLAEHEIHHRSQLCSYLTQLEIAPPPLYGIYTEDLPE